MMFFCLLLLQRLLSSKPLKHRLMNSEANDKNRKNYSKTIATAGIGFLLIAAALTFSFANYGQQLASAQQGGNATGGNATSTTLLVAAQKSFEANGPVTATIQEGGGGGGGNQSGGGGNQSGGATNATTSSGSEEGPYIIGGNWNIKVENGGLTDFGVHFIMVHTDGSGYHTHDITNFKVGNNTITWIPGQELTINGTADIAVNGTTKWPGADTTMTIMKDSSVVTIMPSADDTDNHFQGQPIYGIVQEAKGENNVMIIQPPQGGPAQSVGGGSNQSGGPLESLTKPLQDLFGGGGQ